MIQAPLSDMVARLQIADPARLFGANGPDGAAIGRAIEQAIAAQGALPPVLPPHLRHLIIAEAGRTLLHAGNLPREAIALTDAVPEWRDTPPMAHIRLLALHQIEGFGKVASETDRLVAASPVTPDMQRVLRHVNASVGLGQSALTATPRLLRFLWGRPTGAFIDTLNTFRADPMPMPPFEPAIAALYAATESGITDYEEYRNRCLWGLMAWNYTEYLLRTCNAIRAAHDDPGLMPTDPRLSDEESRLLSNVGQLMSMIRLPALPTAPPEPGAERTQLMMGSHTGMCCLLELATPEQDLPRTLISHGLRPDVGTAFNISTAAPDANFRFARLLKMIRKSPRHILLYPDGAAGETAEVTVLGRKMHHIGRGAALLAYYGKADTHMLLSEWHGDEIHLRRIVGPTVQDGESLADFESRLLGFYAGHLERIYKGPPEDIGISLIRML